ncbi:MULTISPECIES: aminotransferase class I/II-fold pyridoxal phosphate-dependent enzyme [unclassified Pseudomonas]|uniref:aminotransferase class I/II-fold pyridoxal phosphate-dependent enzyme n=1 Tax=unclassified Pseudomonas TaxID=196821 RepID=UPI002AC9045B|nr:MULTISPECIES: aminotransferase class I/II-fold pyridoxal phosphate-dependent enzyme [unclassified Pseudomonas]MEB0048211.1 aminotransferase class I/II-fold pyridoxal phosphate-dependent enzyme [Pseudomonas sp. Dout3]MEB0096634.1 aminotransferase class I/II-fold pyridoxal phosphate-dependent enzyme [Pseudomonas sp. DC1.2]WPX60245.1 aminotransferase class I/II-fold pyridoxal phosphate-dependent enzyme [Pseudomonas sp. DC1.2]
MNLPPHATHTFSHYRHLISLADHDWETAEAGKISGLNVDIKSPNRMLDQHGREFHHFSTTSYLGLEHHPHILDGAIASLLETGTLGVANAKNQCKLALLERYETELSQLFGTHCLSTLSCSAASTAILPLLASGVFTQNRPPVMVFDRLAHDSMSHLKAACADETSVLTAPHNDMDFLEKLCQRYTTLVYVTDSAYSMGGVADLDSLLYLKNRYGLFLYLDESHALSTVGAFGAGLVRPRMDALEEDCLIVASLAKSFGASGGLVMLGSERQRKLLARYGGPSYGSQNLNSAAIGAGRASIQLHRTSEFAALQQKLQLNIRLFDSLISTDQQKSNLPIRLVNCGEAALANRIAIELANQGFFTSAVFFPAVAHGNAALRITLRADMEPPLIRHFCALVTELLRPHGRDVTAPGPEDSSEPRPPLHHL